jgi:hypothetical protein
MVGITTAPLGKGRTGIAALAALAAAVVAAAIVLAAAPSAQAACVRNTAWTDINLPASDRFRISSTSPCSDLNAAYTFTYNDYVRGWYYDSGGGLHVGSRGFVYVDKSDNGLVVLLSDVLNGTRVFGEGLSHSQYVRYAP